MTTHAAKDFRRFTRSRPARAFGAESLERRVLMSGDVVDPGVDAPATDNKSPQVEAVYVAGTEWAPTFLAYLEKRNKGSAEFGFEVGPGGGGNNNTLPWINLDQISIQFDEAVVVQQDDLEITGRTGGDYAVTAFSYDPETSTATWTLDESIPADVLTLRLDGTSATGVTDLAGNPLHGNDNGDGTGGAPARDFVQDLPVLPGDADRNGVVLARDYAEVKQKFFSSATDVPEGVEKYSIFHDVDGSGVILARDYAEVKKRFFSRLPEED